MPSMPSPRRGQVATAALLLLAASSSPLAAASIFQRVGAGACLPAHGDEYSHMRTANTASDADCSAACDRANPDGESRHHYRGFMRVHKDHVSLGGTEYGRGACLCLYDCHHLPELLVGDEAEDEWIRYDAEDVHGEGEISGTDGTAGVQCFEVVIEQAVTPKEDPDVLWRGYHNT